MVKPAFLLAASLLLASVALAAPFQNGSFENGVNPPTNQYRSLFTGDTSIDGWIVTGRIDWSPKSQNPGWAEDGNLGVQPIVVNGQPSSISQTFDTLPGQAYQVSFYVTPTPYSEQNTSTSPLYVDFTNAGTTQTSVVSFDPDQNVYAYARYDFVFTTAAGASSSALDFRNDATYVGPFIDNVTVQAVPEPASLAALGIAAVGFWRRKAVSLTP